VHTLCLAHYSVQMYSHYVIQSVNTCMTLCLAQFAVQLHTLVVHILCLDQLYCCTFIL
jgi:hypothetical protein